jgi:hypothetical protein
MADAIEMAAGSYLQRSDKLIGHSGSSSNHELF